MKLGQVEDIRVKQTVWVVKTHRERSTQPCTYCNTGKVTLSDGNKYTCPVCCGLGTIVSTILKSYRIFSGIVTFISIIKFGQTEIAQYVVRMPISESDASYTTAWCITVKDSLIFERDYDSILCTSEEEAIHLKETLDELLNIKGEMK